MSRWSHPLAGADGYRQSILPWGIGTVVRRVVVAERVIPPIEIEIVDSRGCALEIQIAAARIRLGAVSEVAERHEQMAQVLLADFDESGQGQELSFQSKGQLADPLMRTALTSRGRNLEDVAATGNGENRRHAILGFHRKIRQRRE